MSAITINVEVRDGEWHGLVLVFGRATQELSHRSLPALVGMLMCELARFDSFARNGDDPIEGVTDRKLAEWSHELAAAAKCAAALADNVHREGVL